jgi:hypothetical protein
LLFGVGINHVISSCTAVALKSGTEDYSTEAPSEQRTTFGAHFGM